MADTSSTAQPSHVTVGILTALEVEYAACKGVFDPHGLGYEHHVNAKNGSFTCWICEVASRRGTQNHVIAITLLSDMGNNAAAMAAQKLLQHCTNTSYMIMCGIAGAVPNPTKPEDHVRLGDIVVSSGHGVIQYDRGKQRDPQIPTSSDSNQSLGPFAGRNQRDKKYQHWDQGPRTRHAAKEVGHN